MKIRKTRVLNISPYLLFLDLDQDFYIGFKDLSQASNLKKTGYNPSSNVGDTFLPNPNTGPTSDFNANGKIIVHKDRKKTMQTREATIKDWRGKSHDVDIDFLAYPKTKIDPPSERIIIQDDGNGGRFFTSRLLKNNPKSEVAIKHIVNLFLELFGECEILNADFSLVIRKNKEVSWDILPKGEFSWEKVEEIVNKIINSSSMSEEDKEATRARIAMLKATDYDTMATGKNTFMGYLVFTYPHKNTYVLESINSGNATYILSGDWEELSKSTKKELLDTKKHKARIIHNSNWETKIKSYIK